MIRRIPIILCALALGTVVKGIVHGVHGLAPFAVVLAVVLVLLVMRTPAGRVDA